MEKKNYILLAIQVSMIAAAGLWGGDTPFALITALIGIVFNFLISVNVATGFLFGFVYAICNGILAWQTSVYASFVFMIFMQAPMALYSFRKWSSKKQESDAIMKHMSHGQMSGMLAGMAVLGVVMLGVLAAPNGGVDFGVFFDTIFFVCSVTSCIGLAACYKNAYVVCFIGGAGGALLWVWKALTMGTGISMAVFFAFVALNGAIGVYQQYFKESEQCNGKIQEQGSCT